MEVIKLIFSTDFAFSILRLTTPILLATLAAMITQRAGVTNMAIEGTMLFAALFGVVFSAMFQSAIIGLLAAILIAVVVSLAIAYFSLHLKADITLACIAMNLLASGGTVFLLYVFSGDRGMSSSLQSKTLPIVNIPLVENIPILGDIISGHNIVTYIAFIMVIIVNILLFKTALGLRMRAVGENENAASSVGISVNKTQTIALVLCGVLCGIAGAYMSMGYLSMFNRDMVAGRGFIALAASNVGGQTPIGGMLAALLFGVFDSLSNNLHGFKIPPEFVQMIPYIATLVLLGISSYNRQKEADNTKKSIVPPNSAHSQKIENINANKENN